MSLTCKFEELDADTRDYLQEVRARRGRGTPGVYVPVANPRPAWALVLGPVVAGAFLVWSLGSPKDPWAVAMLQTAGLLVGGWCVMYAFRRWFAGRGKKYGGYFAYFDPLFAYQAQGETVTATRLKTVRAVEADANRVWFDLGERGEVVVPVPNPVQAHLVEEYYAAMDRLERQEDGPWRDAPVAELGAAARMAAEDDGPPRQGDALDLDVEKVPEAPSRANRAGFGWPALFLILLAAAGLYGLLWAVNRPLGDDLAFERAKEDGAPGLRGYLLDERNTRHRDEAKQLLAKQYDPAVAKLRAATPGKNPELREGMVKLVESLRTADSPVVSIDVKEEGPGDGGGVVRAGQLRQEVADGLARAIGPQLIVFAAPAEGQPAHLTIRYRLTPAGNQFSATAEAEIRTELDQGPVAARSWEAIDRGNAVNPAPLVNQLRAAICTELVGSYAPAPPPEDFGGGDF
jgi:hypothetical protein